MKAVNLISSFDGLFFKLQEYCDQFEEFNGFKQVLGLQTEFEGEEWVTLTMGS